MAATDHIEVKMLRDLRIDDELYFLKGIAADAVFTVAEHEMSVVLYFYKGCLKLAFSITIGIEAVETVEP